MIQDLSETQIDELLNTELVGRIGCHTKDMVYIVPINYAYDGKDVYAHTYEGLKIAIMRKNPNVCFQVDNLKDMGNWQSVIAWGKFDEVKDREERNNALRLLLNRVTPMASGSTAHLGSSWPFYSEKFDEIGGLVLRIRLTNRTGRFENCMADAAVSVQ